MTANRLWLMKLKWFEVNTLIKTKFGTSIVEERDEYFKNKVENCCLSGWSSCRQMENAWTFVGGVEAVRKSWSIAPSACFKDNCDYLIHYSEWHTEICPHHFTVPTVNGLTIIKSTIQVTETYSMETGTSPCPCQPRYPVCPLSSKSFLYMYQSKWFLKPV